MITYTLDLSKRRYTFTRQIAKFVEFKVVFKTRKELFEFMKYYVKDPQP